MIIKCDWCGKEFNKKPFEVARYEHHYCSKQCYGKMFEADYRKRFAELNPQFKIIEYIDKNDVSVECIVCGNKREHLQSKNAIDGNVCLECRKQKTQKKKKRKSEINAQLRNVREKIKRVEYLEKRITIEYNKKLRHENAINNNRARQKTEQLRREGRIKNNGAVDKDITLERLFDREGGQCHICGLLCNYEDYKITEEGYFIVGKFYPSIDHVVPLSKGGTHTWNNIKLAHISCNSWKGNKFPQDQ